MIFFCFALARKFHGHFGGSFPRGWGAQATKAYAPWDLLLFLLVNAIPVSNLVRLLAYDAIAATRAQCAPHQSQQLLVENHDRNVFSTLK